MFKGVGQWLQLSKRYINIFAIETSCDDTSVCLLNNKRGILSSKTFTDRNSQVNFGGICPEIAAKQHRNNLPQIIAECFSESGVAKKEITAVAVTTTPGLVICLKEGIKSAIELAKRLEKPLIPVHHMRAHALAAFLESSCLRFPFISVLISGGHAQIAQVNSVDDFKLLGTSISGSPGECLDKLAREMKICDMPDFRQMHPGAAIELLASEASVDGHLHYSIPGPSVPAADMNFSQLKSNLLGALKKISNTDEFSLRDFCATVQYQVTRHICTRLNVALSFLKDVENLPEFIVIGGGVASNKYIRNAVSKLSAAYGLTLVLIPQRLCTDNAEMIAITGLLKWDNRSTDIYDSTALPDTIYAHARSEIGQDVRHLLVGKPSRMLSGPSLHGDKPAYIYTKDDFKK